MHIDATDQYRARMRGPRNRRLLIAVLWLASLVFTGTVGYWQGFYRGADMALCAVGASITGDSKGIAACEHLELLRWRHG